MEFKRLIFSLLLTTATSSTFALNNQEIVTLLNQQTKKSNHHALLSKQNNSQLNWTSLQGPRTGSSVKIVQMKNNASILFAFRPYVSGNLYKSTDGGQNWKALSIPKNTYLFDVASIDENRLLIAADHQIYSSTDQGEHWSVSAKLNGFCQSLFVLNPNLILLETNIQAFNPGLYRSLDGGKTWTPAQLGLDMSNFIYEMNGRDNILLIHGSGLQISTNNAVLWTQPENWKNYNAESIAISSKHDIFFAGYKIYKTDANGKTPEIISNDIKSEYFQIIMDNQDRLYAASKNYDPHRERLYQSVDSGKTWKFIQEFERINYMTTLDNGNLIVSTNEGLMQYDEKSDALVKMPFAFSVSTTTKVTALDENNLFAIDDGSIVGSLYSSHDSGKTWELSLDGKVTDIEAFNNRLLKIGTNSRNLLASDDKGKTWQKITSPSNEGCDRLSSQQDALILSCYDGQYLTRDFSSWKKLQNSGRKYVYGHSIYSSDRESIKYSNDDGQTWKTLLDNLHNFGTEITGYQDKVILVAVYEAGIIKTTDSGATWDLISNGIEDYHFSKIKALDENIYIAATDGGVYLTSDGGNNWIAENNGLDNIDIQSLFVDQNMLLVGTDGGGVFKALLKK